MKKRFLLLTFLFLISCGKKQISSEEIKYYSNELYIMNDNKKIYGKLYEPVSKNNSLVILSHSLFLNGDSLSDYASEFSLRGYDAFTFDFCGGSYNSKSDGDVSSMSVFTEVNDLTAILEFFKAKNVYENIYLFGTSQGGLVSSLVANNYYNDISKLILLYPAFNLSEAMESPYAEKMFSETYINAIKGYDIYSNIKKFEKNVIIFYGDKDNSVSRESIDKALKVYKNGKLVLINGAGHGFNKKNYSFSNYDEIVWKELDLFLN